MNSIDKNAHILEDSVLCIEEKDPFLCWASQVVPPHNRVARYNILIWGQSSKGLTQSLHNLLRVWSKSKYSILPLFTMAGVIHLDKKLCTKKQDGILEDAFR